MDAHAVWMGEAITEAMKAAAVGDIPIGAIAVRDGVIIGRGHNRREAEGDPSAHAEIDALRQAAQVVGEWRLHGVTLYCTLEPCVMCAGAMVQARLPMLVWAADDPKAGAGGSVLNILTHPRLNHRVEVVRGVLADEAAAQIREFFAELRQAGQRLDD
jgi:tRNA(adenine34) deaminase